MFFAGLLLVISIAFVCLAAYILVQYRSFEGAVATAIICVAAIAFFVFGIVAFHTAQDRSNARWQVKQLHGMGFNEVRYNQDLDTVSATLPGQLAGCQISLYYESGYDDSDEEDIDEPRWLLDSPPGDRRTPVTSWQEVAKRPDVVRWCNKLKE